MKYIKVCNYLKNKIQLELLLLICWILLRNLHMSFDGVYKTLSYICKRYPVDLKTKLRILAIKFFNKVILKLLLVSSYNKKQFQNHPIKNSFIKLFPKFLLN